MRRVILRPSRVFISSRGGRLTSLPFCLPGMVDIARQTVEFLYEENGGIPRDLYLPTIEDIKDEANKFTIDKVRKGKLSHECVKQQEAKGLWCLGCLL